MVSNIFSLIFSKQFQFSKDGAVRNGWIRHFFRKFRHDPEI